MHKWILLAVLVLLVFMPRCELAWLWECATDSDCDDGNPCTTDDCRSEYEGPCDNSCDDCRRYWCRNRDVDDGTPCEVDGQTGVCGGGECRREGAGADRSGDGGI